MSKHILNVAAELKQSTVNGPGQRYVIWVQGCPKKCPGCFNQAFRPFIPRNLVDVNALARRIFNTSGIEGVTYSGGEPMIQAKSLYHLSKIIKENGLSIVCYTGFTIEELKSSLDPFVSKLLRLVDILIDGPYNQSQNATLLWRGSQNQRVIFLSETYGHLKHCIDYPTQEMEIVVADDGSLIFTGMIDEKLAMAIRQR